MMRITDTVKHLIIINVVMFIGTLAISNGVFYDWFAMHFPRHEGFRLWQIFTHMFMHGGADINNLSISHLLFNMFALWMFGSSVEQILGAKRFIFIYISAGLGAVALQVGYHYYDFYTTYETIKDLNIDGELLDKIISINARDGLYIKGEVLGEQLFPLLETYGIDASVVDKTVFKTLFDLNLIARSTMVGASGCIMGIMAAFGMMNPNAELMMIFLPIPIKAKYFIPGIILIDLVSGISGHSFFSPSNTAHFAHVGGALTGAAIMWYWKKTQFNRNRWN